MKSSSYRDISSDENCQGCRRDRNAERPNTIEVMFANEVTLLMSAKTKTDQDEWLQAIMKGLSQGVSGINFQLNCAFECVHSSVCRIKMKLIMEVLFHAV